MTFIEQLKELVNPDTFAGALFYLVVFSLLAWLIARLMRSFIHHILKRDGRGLVDKTAASFFSQLGQIVIYIAFFILYVQLIPGLRSLGVALLAGAGVISIIIGMAAQNTLGNIIAGFSILMYRPFKIGDRLQVNAPGGLETGEVESLNLGYTVVRSPDNRRVIIPNQIMASSVTINLTEQHEVTANIPIAINRTGDIDKARGIILNLALGNALTREVIKCPVTKLDEVRILLTLQVKCLNSDQAKELEYFIYEQAAKQFAASGIETPLPSTALPDYKIE